jgi:hypothetical protein
MQNAKIFRVMLSSIQNAEFIVLMKPLVAHFGFFPLLRPKSKMENNYLFAKNFAWCVSSILQNDEPKPKIFWKKMRTKHPPK